MFTAESFSRESRTADGMEFQALSFPNEWRQIPKIYKGATSKLFNDCHVHCSSAPAPVFCVQVMYVIKKLAIIVLLCTYHS